MNWYRIFDARNLWTFLVQLSGTSFLSMYHPYKHAQELVQETYTGNFHRIELCVIFWLIVWCCVCRSGWQLESDSIATFSVDSKSGRELRPYLSSVTDKCEQNAADLPKVIIIDGLHHISSPLSDAFNGFLNVDHKSRSVTVLRLFLCAFYAYL